MMIPTQPHSHPQQRKLPQSYTQSPQTQLPGLHHPRCLLWLLPCFHLRPQACPCKCHHLQWICLPQCCPNRICLPRSSFRARSCTCLRTWQPVQAPVQALLEFKFFEATAEAGRFCTSQTAFARQEPHGSAPKRGRRRGSSLHCIHTFAYHSTAANTNRPGVDSQHLQHCRRSYNQIASVASASNLASSADRPLNPNG